MEKEIPRKDRLDLNTPAELAIYNAIQQVEKVGANPKLTDVVLMLTKAKDLLAESIDDLPLIQKIKTFDDILLVAKRRKEDFSGIEDRLPSDEIAYRKIKLIAEVLNEGWTPDWSNSDQCKYYSWFKHNSASGGFAYGDYGSWSAGTTVGSRLCFKSSELAEFAGTTFIDIYNDFLTLNK